MTRLTALQHPNFRLFFYGQLASLTGSWMQSVALSWFVWRLSHSAVMLGVIIALQFLPSLVLTPFGGLAADRYDRRRLLLLTQSLFIIPSAGLFTLAVIPSPQIWEVGVAALVTGLINAVDVPVRQALVPDLVGRRHMISAVALNSTVFNATRVAGPAIAGPLIATVGVASCFGLNALSYLAIIAATLRMRDLPRLARPKRTESTLHELRRGFSFVRSEPAAGATLLVVSAFSLFAMNNLTLMPIFADHVLHTGATGFGLLLAATGVGAVISALSLAFKRDSSPTPRRLVLAALALSASLVAFALSQSLWFSLLLATVAGWAQIRLLITANTRMQLITPDHLRGRVMSIYGQAVLGSGPPGALQAGVLAATFGAPVALISGAVIAAVCLIGVRTAMPRGFQPVRAAAEVPPPTVTLQSA